VAERAEQAADESSIKGGGGAFAGGVTEDDGGLAVVIFEEVEEIAGDVARGAEADGDIEPFDGGGFTGQEDRSLSIRCSRVAISS
jgi:hypothetical protein